MDWLKTIKGIDFFLSYTTELDQYGNIHMKVRADLLEDVDIVSHFETISISSGLQEKDGSIFEPYKTIELNEDVYITGKLKDSLLVKQLLLAKRKTHF